MTTDLPRGVSISFRHWPEHPDDDRASRHARHRRLGRTAARDAASRAEGAVGADGVADWNTDVVPWPQGVVGSIAHTDGLAVAVASPMTSATTIGVDVETVRPRHAALFHRMAAVDGLPPDTLGAGARATVTWAIREAIYKAAFPLTGATTPYLTCSVTIDAARVFHAELPGTNGLAVLGRWQCSRRWAVALCWTEPTSWRMPA